MHIIKPKTLSLLTNTYQFKSKKHLVVGAVCLFRLVRADSALNELLPEAEFLGSCHEALGKGVFDLGIHKNGAEFLAAGAAFAPRGETRARMPVAITLAGKSKQLEVHGKQYRKQGLLLNSYSAVEPFASMPISYATAYGGSGYAANPLGTGFGSAGRGKQMALPNVVYPGVKQRSKQSTPAAFAAMGVDWPDRLKLAGTYDNTWWLHEAPGYPHDIDWCYFNLAAVDQRFSKPLQGGENYRIEGMHPDMPCMEGRLPDIKARVFVSEDTSGHSGWRELATALDTVWFFPDRNLGMLIQRGVTTVKDSEAQDIAAVLLAYENNGDQARDPSFYQNVMQLRTDRATALASAFNESQLTPVKSPQAQQEQVVAKAAWRQQCQAAQAQQRAALLAEISGKLGLKQPLAPSAAPADAGETAALRKLEALPDPALLITPEQLQKGDFDLSELLAAVDQLNAQAKVVADEARQKAADQIKQAPALKQQLQTQHPGLAINTPPDQDQAALLEKCRQRAALQITGITDPLNMDAVINGAAATGEHANALVDKQARQLDQGRLATLQAGADELGERTQRLVRLRSPQPCYQQPPAQADKLAQAANLRALFVDLLARGESLCGRDFAGVNLSGLNLAGLDLSELMLEHADLSHCNLRGTRLYGAVLTNATVDNSDFTGADLRSSNLSGLCGTHCCFDTCHFDAAMMHNLQLPASSWRQASLQGNTLLQCDLAGAGFNGAQLCQVTMIKCKLTACDFSAAMYRKFNGTDNCFRQSRFVQSRWDGVSLLDNDFAESDFTNASFRRSISLGKTCYRLCNFTGVSAIETGWRNLDLSSSCFAQAAFGKSDFAGSKLCGSDLRAGCFSGSLFIGADCRQMNAAGADFYRATLRKADFTGSTLTNANLQGADVHETVFSNCNLKGVKTDTALKEAEHA